mmetsp:Transcript_339/g.2691  ORF Transcript_339/g.2691 Transcript_339/m.2691 type:complete len:208 (+) Transcript_339:409-1032(+)
MYVHLLPTNPTHQIGLSNISDSTSHESQDIEAQGNAQKSGNCIPKGTHQHCRNKRTTPTLGHRHGNSCGWTTHIGIGGQQYVSTIKTKQTTQKKTKHQMDTNLNKTKQKQKRGVLQHAYNAATCTNTGQKDVDNDARNTLPRRRQRLQPTWKRSGKKRDQQSDQRNAVPWNPKKSSQTGPTCTKNGRCGNGRGTLKEIERVLVVLVE